MKTEHNALEFRLKWASIVRGYPLTLLKNDIQLGKSETVGDTSQVLSRFLGAMTYRCFSHDDVVELAKFADVPVLNALTDKHHPCQATR